MDQRHQPGRMELAGRRCRGAAPLGMSREMAVAVVPSWVCTLGAFLALSVWWGPAVS